MKKTAQDFAREQKEITVSEFFEKNKHLLGFDNPTKALLMAVKEAVDNSLDATEESGVLPDLIVRIRNMSNDKYRVTVQDNGPGIVKEQIPKIFGKLLYGSKFHRLRQNRGQQGIGISSVVLYSQLTTGSPTKIWSRTDEKKKTNYYELFIDTTKNDPEIVKEEKLPDGFKQGTKIEMNLTGRYRKVHGVDDYLKHTSVANPFAKIVYHAPDGTKMTFPRSVDELPKQPKEMKLHPYGVEFGILLRLLGKTRAKTLQAFLVNEFSSIGARSAKEMCKVSKLKPSMKPGSLVREQVEKLLGAMQKVKVQRPPLDCLSPIGKGQLEKSLKKEYPEAEFITVVTRDPSVYRGMPFQIEVGIVHGIGKTDETIDIMRFANRVPLIYQAGACGITEAIKNTSWKRYGLQQSGNNIPVGPMKLVIHMCSVWVPFVSESKEAIAPYPEIVKEVKLAVQDAGRDLSRYLSGKRRAGEQKRRIQIFDRYSGEVAEALSKLSEKNEKEIKKKIKEMVKKRIHTKNNEDMSDTKLSDKSREDENKEESKRDDDKEGKK